MADALRALAYTATGGHTLPASTAVAYPAHWTTSAVDALGAALGRVPEWSPAGQPLLLIPDAAAALFAARANPGIPARGVVAVCDFGGSGTSITLADASGEYQPLGATVRHPDFSGDLIDQSLLTYVMSEMPATGSFDPSGTSAIGSLNRLRAECRQAKEQLSLSTVATLSDALPGVSGEVRLTRNELDETIRDSLDGFARVVEHTLQRAGVPAADLVAIVTVGGGANIPSVTTTLSGRFGVPVITAPRPQLTAATGGALRAARGPGDSSATVLTSAAPMTQTAMAPLDPDVGAVAAADAPVSALQPALAWSEADDQSRAMPVVGDDYSGASGYTSARPQLTFDRECPGGAGAQVRGDPVVPPARSNHRRNGGCGAARRRRGRDRAELRRTAGDSLARSDHVPAHLGPRSRATGDRCRNFRARAVHSATCLPRSRRRRRHSRRPRRRRPRHRRPQPHKPRSPPSLRPPPRHRRQPPSRRSPPRRRPPRRRRRHSNCPRRPRSRPFPRFRPSRRSRESVSRRCRRCRRYLRCLRCREFPGSAKSSRRRSLRRK